MNIKYKKLFLFLFPIFFIIGAFLFFAPVSQALDLGQNTAGNIGLGGRSPVEITIGIVKIFLGLLALLTVAIMIYAGFLWMTSRGDAEKISLAKKILIGSIIGVVIILASFGIVQFVIGKMIDVTTPGVGVSCDLDENIPGCQDDGSCGSGLFCDSNSNCTCQRVVNPTPPTPQKSCDSNPLVPECNPDDTECLAGEYCDPLSCLCVAGGIGDDCNATTTQGVCDPDNDLCGFGLVCDSNSCKCALPGSLGDNCNATSTQGVCDPDSDLCGYGLACDDNSCLCEGVPIIEWISPDAGVSGNIVSIGGRNFGDTPGKVFFSDGLDLNLEAKFPDEINPLCDSNWSDDLILVIIPENTASGSFSVVRADGESDDSDDEQGPLISDFSVDGIVRPGICKLNPIEGRLDESIDVNGVNILSAQANMGVYDNFVSAKNNSFLSETAGTCQVPLINSGETSVFVKNDGKESNYLKFKKLAEEKTGPYIMSFSPTQGAPGQYITVLGSGFGNNRATSRVFFGDENTGFEADYIFPEVCAGSVWNKNRLIIKVPDNIPDGNYKITIDLGFTIIDSSGVSPNSFQADNSLDLLPSLCRISPAVVQVGSKVSLWGEYFGSFDNDSSVIFYKNKKVSGADIDYWDVDYNDSGIIKPDKIETTISIGSETGPVSVAKNNPSLIGNSINLEVGSCLSADNPDLACQPDVCCPAGTYQEGRCLSDINDCYAEIEGSVYEWGFSTDFEPEDPPQEYGSCVEMSREEGKCNPYACPNSAGRCSPYAGGNKQIVADCDYSCDIPECLSANCSYSDKFDKCLDNVLPACDLPIKETGVLNEELSAVCEVFKGNNRRVIYIEERSCPSGWTRELMGQLEVCVDMSSTCDMCGQGFACVDDENNDDRGLCMINKDICPGDSICESDDKCKIVDSSTCDCCCRMDKEDEDCCSGLSCSGVCGEDMVDDGIGLGLCSGCRQDVDKNGVISPSEQALSDSACNCDIGQGKYCDVNAGPDNDNNGYPDGVCRDCAQLSSDSCSEHNTTCCLDGEKGNICRGGVGDNTMVANDSNYYCRYFECTNDNSACSVNNPVAKKSNPYIKIFSTEPDCQSGCSGDTPPPSGDPCDSDTNTPQCDPDNNMCNQGEICNINTCICEPNNIPPGSPCDSDTNTPQCDPDNNMCASGETCDPGTCICSPRSPSGLGLSCQDKESSDCDTASCSFSCINLDGSGASYPDCGTCCCDPNNDTCSSLSPDLVCQPDNSPCSGDSRGLCCGCVDDSDCGSPSSSGCGVDSCCRARPSVVETIPADAEKGVCTNASIKVKFNQTMNVESFSENIIVFGDYGAVDCPKDTEYIVYGKNNQQTLLAKMFNAVSGFFGNFFKKEAQASSPPNPSANYCSIAGSISVKHIGETETELVFSPNSPLDANRKYFGVIKGDFDLNDSLKIGALSLWDIGLNSGNSPVAQGSSFNGKNYKNSYIWSFETMADQDGNGGLCSVDSVNIIPKNYLFNNNTESLEEDDADYNNSSYDTVRDRDKEFVVEALSADGQALSPVYAYNWEWKWSIDNSNLAYIDSNPHAPTSSKQLVEIVDNVLDGRTEIEAQISINQDVYNLGGDGLSDRTKIFVFICDNPWPPTAVDGSWKAWGDKSGNCSVYAGDSCHNYQYEIYYCRDFGSAGFIDDLPAIISDDAIIRGADSDQDILKESYFLRENRPDVSASVISADVYPAGERIDLYWDEVMPESGETVSKYEIYYSSTDSDFKKIGEVLEADAPYNTGNDFRILNLNNGEKYYFAISAIYSDGGKSNLSESVSAIPQDTKAPLPPEGLEASARDKEFGISVYAQSDNKNGKVAFNFSSTDLGDEKISIIKKIRVDYGTSAGNYTNSKEVEAYKLLKNNEFLEIDSLSDGSDYYFSGLAFLGDDGVESESFSEIKFSINSANDSEEASRQFNVNIPEKVEVSWIANKDDDTDGYKIYYGFQHSLYGQPIEIKGKDIDKAMFTVDNPTSMYFITIKALDQYGNESSPASEVIVVPAEGKSMFQDALTNVGFEEGSVGSVPTFWSKGSQADSAVGISDSEAFSGSKSLLIFQSPNKLYPGVCEADLYNKTPPKYTNYPYNFVWDGSVCDFPDNSRCNDSGQCIIQSGNNLVWPYQNRTMWAKIVYDVSDLNWQIGETYLVSFYYKGKLANRANPSLGFNLGWKNQCCQKKNNVCPCGSYGDCADQSGYCCKNAPYQKECYDSIELPRIDTGTYNEWTNYFTTFEYTQDLAKLLDDNGDLKHEIGISVGYGPTGSEGTEFYIDDFIIATKVN